MTFDLRLFQFTLLEVGNWVDAEQSTGRMIHVPNGMVLTHPLANYTTGFEHIWDEIPVLITFESNWRKAKDLLGKIAVEHAQDLTEEARRRVQEASRRFLIFYSKLTPVVYTSVRDHGVLLTIRYMSLPRERRGKQEIMWEAILTAFGQCDDIDLAYPTTRFYHNLAEGKSGAKGGGPPG